VLLVENQTTMLLLIATGLLVMQAGVWYMANPVLTSERRNLGLRTEVDRFIGLVRRLDRAVLASGTSDDVDKLRAGMHESVDEMGRLVGDPTAARPEESAIAAT